MLVVTLKELKDITDNMSLKVIPSKMKADGTPRFLKKDYIRAMQLHHLTATYPDGPPQHLLSALYLKEGPMLAARSTDLKDEDLKEVWESSEWVFEEKWDGVRMWIIFNKGEGFHFYSRNLSVHTFCPCNYTNIHYTVDTGAVGDTFESFVIDAELMCSSASINTFLRNKGVITETYLQAVTALLQLNDEESLAIQRQQAPLYWRAFDVLMLNDNWDIGNLPLLKRKVGLDKIVHFLSSQGMDVRPTDQVTGTVEKAAFYDKLIQEGGEGVVAKHITSTYVPGGRKKTHWVKIKRSMSETLARQGLGDTLDGWITGCEPGTKGKANEGKVGTIVVSCYIEKESGTKYIHEIAKISGITAELRDKMTVIDEEGEVALHKDYMGLIVEVDGQSVSARSKRLRHAKLIRFRPDKNADDCVLSETFLNEMVL